MGSGAIKVPDFINHPTRGLVMVDRREWERLTQRNDFALNQQSFPTGVVNSRINFRMPNRGIATELRLWFTLTLTQTLTAARDKWIYNLMKNIRVRANSSDIVNCSGLDLHMLRQIYANSGDFTGIEATTAASGAQTYRWCSVIPLCTDPDTLTGAVFAETDDTYLEVELATETEAEVLSTASTTWSSLTVDPYLTTYDVPHVRTSKGDAIVIPPMDTHHMLGSRDTDLTSTGEKRIAVSRANGQLLRLFLATYDASAYSYLNYATVANSLRLQYGQNQVLRKHSPRDLQMINARNYEDVLPKQYACFDFVSENSFRDVVVPDAVTDLEAVIDFASTVTTGDYVHSFEQVVVASPTWAQATPVDMAAG